MRSIVLIALALAVGCSAFAPTTQTLIISATDPKATLVLDGVSYGTGPKSVRVAPNISHSIMAFAGDRHGTATVGRQLSSYGVLDIIGGCIWLVPFFGLASPGAWELERSGICVMVPPEPGAPPLPEALAIPAEPATPVAKPKPPVPKPLDRRIHDQSDYAWPTY